MTCIVGLVDDGKVVIGGDSAGVNGAYELQMVGAIRRGEFWKDHSSPMTGMFSALLAANESNNRRTA
jgi:hypothetical protein